MINLGFCDTLFIRFGCVSHPWNQGCLQQSFFYVQRSAIIAPIIATVIPMAMRVHTILISFPGASNPDATSSEKSIPPPAMISPAFFFLLSMRSLPLGGSFTDRYAIICISHPFLLFVELGSVSYSGLVAEDHIIWIRVLIEQLPEDPEACCHILLLSDTSSP